MSFLLSYRDELEHDLDANIPVSSGRNDVLVAAGVHIQYNGMYLYGTGFVHRPLLHQGNGPYAYTLTVFFFWSLRHVFAVKGRPHQGLIIFLSHCEMKSVRMGTTTIIYYPSTIPRVI